MAVGDAYVFPGFLTPVITQLFFLTYFCRGERRKYAGKKSRLNRGSNSQPLGHESDTIKPPRRGRVSPVLGWSSEGSCPRTLPEKKNPRGFRNESNTFSLSNACPNCFSILIMTKIIMAHKIGFSLFFF